jgi:hypothetical protein
MQLQVFKLRLTSEFLDISYVGDIVGNVTYPSGWFLMHKPFRVLGIDYQ